MSSNLAAWLEAIGTILLAIIAVFQDKIRAWVMRPRLDVSFELQPPHCHKGVLRRVAIQDRRQVVASGADTYFFRLSIRNTGNRKADSVEVIAQTISKQQADGRTFRPIDSLLPMNLVWAHRNEPFYPTISPGTHKLCDLGHIIDPPLRAQLLLEDRQWSGVEPSEAIFSFATEVKPFTLEHLIPPGTYRLSIAVAAANCRPVRKIIEIHLTGKWYTDEARMLGEGISIQLLS